VAAGFAPQFSEMKAQKPAMQVLAGCVAVAEQQSASFVQRSSRFAQLFCLGAQVPTGSTSSTAVGKVQVPPQQSMPLVHESPSRLQGSSAANAR
jgi:hypothetical protein